MASITIRNLDKKSKQWLRMRAAGKGRSMEEEARLLFDELRQRDETPIGGALPKKPAPLPDQSPTSPQNVALAGWQGQRDIDGKSILLIISAGIAAYKSLDLIRRLRERGASIRTILTPAAEQFVTPVSVAALTGEKVFSDLFAHDEQHDIGHISLSREADLLVVAPATADLMAKMANGLADDLASCTLLANNQPILLAPAMNPAMWQNAATRRNVATLVSDGINFIGPNSGEMAESGEAGTGRMAEPLEIVAAIVGLLDDREKPLQGLRAVITSGPTREAIDPVRYLSNHSSGKQGHAIASALARAGAEVILVSGPVSIAEPAGVSVVHVETALEMQQAVDRSLPADIAIFVAAVADWRPQSSVDQKIKKTKNQSPPTLQLVENPDILKGIGRRKKHRPSLVIGFAAETSDIVKHATAKLASKGADWILANDVSAQTGILGGDDNTIQLISNDGVDNWPPMKKHQVAERLVRKIIAHFEIETIDT